MLKSYTLLSCACLALTGCTLTPAHFDGEDLLDSGHRTEMQDPVTVPVKEFSDRPPVKASPAPPVVLDPKKAAAPVEKPVPLADKVASTAPAAPVEPAKTKTQPVGCMDKNGPVAPPLPPTGMAKKSAAQALPQTGKLQNGERLKINVYREKDLTGHYQIDDKGMISFPLIGQVKAAGLSLSELQEKLFFELKKGYLVKPEISIERLPDCNSRSK